MVVQTTHHSGSMTVDVSIKSRFLETLQNCINLSSICFAKSLFEMILNLKTLLPSVYFPLDDCPSENYLNTRVKRSTCGTPNNICHQVTVE